MMFPMLTFEEKIPLGNGCFHSMRVRLEAGNLETIALSLFLSLMNNRERDPKKRREFSSFVDDILWSDEFQRFMELFPLKIIK